MKIALLTKEFPPHIYGGAGVHVDNLARHLVLLNAADLELEIVCFGDQKQMSPNLKISGVQAEIPLGHSDPGRRILLDSIVRDAAMIAELKTADLIHCHTWYTHLAGCLLKQILGAPLILTTHSIEQKRPWKQEQLGRAYYGSLWLEQTAYRNADGIIAVSWAMKNDVAECYGVPADKITVIPNGIDLEEFCRIHAPDVLSAYGIEASRPYILMVCRLTPQKGVLHFLEALPHLMPGVQAVICGSAPDTPAYLQKVSKKVARIRQRTENRIIWITEAVPRKDLVALYSHADIFVCPSIYEPFGIINLEAMACETPVVASAVGGIPDVVSDGSTGRLVAFEASGPDNPEPKNPELFAGDLAAAINALLAAPGQREAMGKQARRWVEAHYSWPAIAQKTLDFYKKVLG